MTNASRLAAAIALVALSLGAVASAQEETLDQFRARVIAAMKEVQTTRGHFLQTKRLAVFDDAVVSSGTFAIKRPGKLRWEIQEPFKSVLVIAGPKGARWNETRKQVERFTLAEKPGIDTAVRQLFQWYSGGFDEASNQFTVTLEKTARTISLVPKNEKMREVISRITIKLAANLATIDAITLEEKDGDRTEIAFSSVETNKELEDKLFELEDR